MSYQRLMELWTNGASVLVVLAGGICLACVVRELFRGKPWL